MKALLLAAGVTFGINVGSALAQEDNMQNMPNHDKMEHGDKAKMSGSDHKKMGHKKKGNATDNSNTDKKADPAPAEAMPDSMPMGK